MCFDLLRVDPLRVKRDGKGLLGVLRDRVSVEEFTISIDVNAFEFDLTEVIGLVPLHLLDVETTCQQLVDGDRLFDLGNDFLAVNR